MRDEYVNTDVYTRSKPCSYFTAHLYNARFGKSKKKKKKKVEDSIFTMNLFVTVDSL